jgi:hypothetical protein
MVRVGGCAGWRLGLLTLVLGFGTAGPGAASARTTAPRRAVIRVVGFDNTKLLVGIRCPARAPRRACRGRVTARRHAHGSVIAAGRFSVRPRHVRLLALRLIKAGRATGVKAVVTKRSIVLDVKLASGLTFDFTAVAPVFPKEFPSGTFTTCPTTAVQGTSSKLTASFNIGDILNSVGLSPADALAAGLQLQSPPEAARIMYFGPNATVSHSDDFTPPVIDSYTYLFNDTVSWPQAGTWEVVASWRPFNVNNSAISSVCKVTVSPPPPKQPIPKVATTLSLTCPSAVPGGSGMTEVSGAISPAVAGAPVTITFTPTTSVTAITPPVVVDHATTGTTGAYTDTASLEPNHSYTAVASWPGDAGHTGASSSTCGPIDVLTS